MERSTIRKFTTLFAFIIAFVSILFLKKCYTARETPPQTPATAVSPTLDKPQADANDYFNLSEVSIKGYRKGNGDLLEKLYKDLVQKTPELQQFELKMDTFRKAKPQITTLFEDFDGKSTDYYNSAETNSRTLSDSLLRKEVRLWLEKSRDSYKNQTTEWNKLLAQLNSKNVRLNDYHNLMKIHLTLPLIEDFQKKRLPPTLEIQNLLLQQAALQQQIDSLMKKR
jgi:hypothetical protein